MSPAQIEQQIAECIANAERESNAEGDAHKSAIIAHVSRAAVLSAMAVGQVERST